LPTHDQRRTARRPGLYLHQHLPGRARTSAPAGRSSDAGAWRPRADDTMRPCPATGTRSTCGAGRRT
jgi:hypothetical protein